MESHAMDVASLKSENDRVHADADDRRVPAIRQRHKRTAGFVCSVDHGLLGGAKVISLLDCLKFWQSEP